MDCHIAALLQGLSFKTWYKSTAKPVNVLNIVADRSRQNTQALPPTPQSADIPINIVRRGRNRRNHSPPVTDSETRNNESNALHLLLHLEIHQEGENLNLQQIGWTGILLILILMVASPSPMLHKLQGKTFLSSNYSLMDFIMMETFVP